MENHPIPQDVTGFKFKLIGSITVKQFLYLLGAGIFCTLFFISPFPFFFKIPAIFLFAFIGMALAFIPIAGRPMDKMIISFVTAIPKENKYVFRKKGVNLLAYAYFQPPKTQAPQKPQAEDSDIAKKRLFFAQMKTSGYKPDANETQFLTNIKSFFDESAIAGEKKPISASVPKPQQSQPVLTPPVQTTPPQQDEVAHIQEELKEAVEEKNKGLDSDALEAKIAELQKELQQTLQDKQQLQNQMVAAARDNDNPVYTPSQEAQPEVTENVKIVDKSSQLSAGFPSLPDIPNILLGIVKDPRGKVLQNILVEVVDKNNVPVRAFKTNALGQFTAATPLANGTYRISFEDPQKKNEFDLIEITLTGAIVQPIEANSTDQREKLRQELFGEQKIAT